MQCRPLWRLEHGRPTREAPGKVRAVSAHRGNGMTAGRQIQFGAAVSRRSPVRRGARCRSGCLVSFDDSSRCSMLMRKGRRWPGSACHRRGGGDGGQRCAEQLLWSPALWETGLDSCATQRSSSEQKEGAGGSPVAVNLSARRWAA
jgi:hypothetical protein